MIRSMQPVLVSITLILMLLAEPLLYGGASPFSQSARRPYLPTLLSNTFVQPSDELRALWVVRDALRNPQSVERLIDFARQGRFHMLLVQVRGRGDAFYRSAQAPPGAELEFPVSQFDPLEYLLILARQAGISVHAWINVYYVWSNPTTDPPAGHVGREHPDWFLSDATGERMNERRVQWWIQDGVEGYYLDPGRAEVRAHIVEVVREILTVYPVDGIHLDYVRYPNRKFGMDASSRTAFALVWGVDPSALSGPRREENAALSPPYLRGLDSLYTAIRVAAIDTLITELRNVCGDVALSAAVLPDPDQAVYEKGQDWAKWVRYGWVDFVVPMMYNDSPEEAETRVRVLHNTIGADRWIPGFALHDGRAMILHRLIAAARAHRTIGTALFSYNVMTEMRFPLRFLDEAFAKQDSL